MVTDIQKVGRFYRREGTCFSWTIKSDDFLGRENRPIYGMKDDRFLLADFIGRQSRPTSVDRLTSPSVSALSPNGKEFGMIQNLKLNDRPRYFAESHRHTDVIDNTQNAELK